MPEAPLTPGAPARWPCPACYGLGHMADGAATFGPDVPGGMSVLEFTIRPTPCWVCRGKGRVLVLPLPDEGVVP